jgi:hypothetical protein
MKNKQFHILLCFVALLLTACEKEPVNNDHGISVALSWADPADAGREIKLANVWIYQSDGKLISQKQYSTKQEVALYIHPIEAGEYKVVTSINLRTPFSSDKAETLENLIMKLDQAAASPKHAHYSVAEVKTETGKNIRAQLPLRRVLAELSIEVEGAPQGTTLEPSVLNVADGVIPSKKDNDKTWGKATDNKQLVALKPTTAKNGKLEIAPTRLMPTVSNASNTYLHLTFRLANGMLRECECEAPLMKSAGKYALKLKYSELKPFMHVNPIKINDWEEGWTVSGEILNPDK